MPRQMTPQEVHDFLDSKPGWIALTTVGPDGFPHTVPTGYFRLGDDVLLGVRNNTLKIRNIRYNPQVSLMIESGSTRRDIKGLMIQGNASVIADPDEFLHYAREAAKLRGVAEADLPTEPRPGAAYIKVSPHKIRSWDYSLDAE